MRVVFMGTPDFAVPCLDYMIREGYDIVSVVTQPDRPKGRGNKIAFSPVKEKAIEHGIPVAQPVRIKKDEGFIESLKSLGLDLIVVVAFGQILPSEVLSLPRYGCINVHASLLPHLRGAAPINWSIINGDKETGVTTMMMDIGLDTGDMLLKNVTPICEEDTAGELHDRLSIIGAKTLVETLDLLKRGELKRTPQDNAQSSYAPMMDKDTGKIKWTDKTCTIKNLVRGTDPWPGAYSHLNGCKLKIWKIDKVDHFNSSSAPGTIWKVDKEGIFVYSGDGSAVIREIQGENGKRVNAYSYTLGHVVNIGDRFE